MLVSVEIAAAAAAFSTAVPFPFPFPMCRFRNPSSTLLAVLCKVGDGEEEDVGIGGSITLSASIHHPS